MEISMKNIRRAVILSVLLVSQVFLSVSLLWAETIVIFHTSDIHGAYTARKEKTGRLKGGFAALASLVEKEANPHFLVDSGDWFQGTPEGNLTRGKASIALMNDLGYAASAIGNHDFDYGQANLAELGKLAQFPLLGANIGGMTAQSLAKPYTIVQAGGVKIGIIGLAGEDTPLTTVASNVSGLSFSNRGAAVEALIPELKQQKVNAIIVLTHSAIYRNLPQSSNAPLTDEDEKNGNMSIAQAAGGAVNVIFGGHLHDVASYLDPKTKTLLVDSGSSLGGVSRVALEFSDGTNEFKSASVSYIPLFVDQTGESSEIDSKISNYTASVAGDMAKVIGTSGADLIRFGKLSDSPLGDFVTDVMREQAKSEIVLYNRTGLRSDIVKGDITMREVYSVMPFDGNIYLFTLTGSQITDIVTSSLVGDDAVLNPGLEISGMEVRCAIDAAAKKLKSLSISVNGKAIDPAVTYKVASGDFTAGYLHGTDIRDTNVMMRDAIIAAIKAQSPLARPQTGRFNCIAE